MQERRDQAVLEALWQTRVVIDEICNPDCIGRAEEADFAFRPFCAPMRERSNRLSLSRRERRIHEDDTQMSSNGEEGD